MRHLNHGTGKGITFLNLVETVLGIDSHTQKIVYRCVISLSTSHDYAGILTVPQYGGNEVRDFSLCTSQDYAGILTVPQYGGNEVRDF